MVLGIALFLPRSAAMHGEPCAATDKINVRAPAKTAFRNANSFVRSECYGVLQGKCGNTCGSSGGTHFRWRGTAISRRLRYASRDGYSTGRDVCPLTGC